MTAGDGSFRGLSERERKALRASVEPYLVAAARRGPDGIEVYVAEVEAAIAGFRCPPDPDLELDQAVRDRFAKELHGVVEGARLLAQALSRLGTRTRTRLAERTDLDRVALERLDALCRIAASDEIVAAAAEPLVESIPSSSPSLDIAFVETLSRIWDQHTSQSMTRDRDGESPWARFVAVASAYAGIDPERACELRVRVFDTSSLGESAELLASLPDA